MSETLIRQNGKILHWVLVRPEPAGQFTAQAADLPDISVTAPSRMEALNRIHHLLGNLLSSGQLVPLEVGAETPPLEWTGHHASNDPEEQAFLDELARSKQEDLEVTLRELDQECSNSSSTPTT